MGLVRPNIDFLREGGVRDGSSPSEDFGEDDTTGERVIRCPWNQRADAVTYFLGYSQLSGGVLQRLTPKPHPDFPHLYATKASASGWKFTEKRSGIDGTTANQFSKAHVKIGYDFVMYPVKEDYGAGSGNDISDPNKEYERFTYVSAVEPETEYLTLPSGSMYYVNVGSVSGNPPKGIVPQGAGKIVSITAVDIKWVQLPYDLYSLGTPTAWQNRLWGSADGTVKPLIGAINKTQLFGWSPGTALLANVKLDIKRHPSIGLSWDVTFKFKINLNADGMGWNWLYFYGAAADQGWYYVSNDTSYFPPGSVPEGKSIYNERELNDCWKVGA